MPISILNGNKTSTNDYCYFDKTNNEKLVFRQCHSSFLILPDNNDNNGKRDELLNDNNSNYINPYKVKTILHKQIHKINSPLTSQKRIIIDDDQIDYRLSNLSLSPSVSSTASSSSSSSDWSIHVLNKDDLERKSEKELLDKKLDHLNRLSDKYENDGNYEQAYNCAKESIDILDQLILKLHNLNENKNEIQILTQKRNNICLRAKYLIKKDKKRVEVNFTGQQNIQTTTKKYSPILKTKANSTTSNKSPKVTKTVKFNDSISLFITPSLEDNYENEEKEEQQQQINKQNSCELCLQMTIDTNLNSKYCQNCYFYMKSNFNIQQ